MTLATEKRPQGTQSRPPPGRLVGILHRCPKSRIRHNENTDRSHRLQARTDRCNVRFHLFTFRLWTTAFALFDEHQGPLGSGNGDEVRTEADNGRVIQKGCNSS